MGTTRETTAGQLMLPTQPTGSPRGAVGDAATADSRGAQGPATEISAAPESPPEPPRTADGRGTGPVPAGDPVRKHEEHKEHERGAAAVTAAVLPFAGAAETGAHTSASRPRPEPGRAAAAPGTARGLGKAGPVGAAGASGIVSAAGTEAGHARARTAEEVSSDEEVSSGGVTTPALPFVVDADLVDVKAGGAVAEPNGAAGHRAAPGRPRLRTTADAPTAPALPFVVEVGPVDAGVGGGATAEPRDSAGDRAVSGRPLPRTAADALSGAAITPTLPFVKDADPVGTEADGAAVLPFAGERDSGELAEAAVVAVRRRRRGAGRRKTVRNTLVAALPYTEEPEEPEEEVSERDLAWAGAPAADGTWGPGGGAEPAAGRHGLAPWAPGWRAGAVPPTGGGAAFAPGEREVPPGAGVPAARAEWGRAGTGIHAGPRSTPGPRAGSEIPTGGEVASPVVVVSAVPWRAAAWRAGEAPAATSAARSGSGHTPPSTAPSAAHSGRETPRPAVPRAPVRWSSAPPGALDLLGHARRALAEAGEAAAPNDRYAAAHLAALRTTAAVLAARARPEQEKPGRRRAPRSAWQLLPEVAPELTEWAAYFASGARKRAAAEAGLPHAVTAREADDLIRDVEVFITLVIRLLSLPPLTVMPENG